MERFNERGSAGLTLATVLIIDAALWGGIFLGRAGEHTDEKVRDVQTYNEQIHNQLSHDYDKVVDLHLDSDFKNFNFRTEGYNGQAEVCNGEFRVTNNTAHIAGKLACTHSEKVTK